MLSKSSQIASNMVTRELIRASKDAVSCTLLVPPCKYEKYICIEQLILPNDYFKNLVWVGYTKLVIEAVSADIATISYIDITYDNETPLFTNMKTNIISNGITYLSKKTSGDTSVSDACSICLEEPTNVLMMPCAHMKIGTSCMKIILMQPRRSRICPICRRSMRVTKKLEDSLLLSSI